MSSPIFYSEGSSPRANDTQLRVAQKILGALIDGGGGAAGSIQIYSGASPPAAPADPSRAAIFYPTAGGTTQQWRTDTQAWV